MDVQQAVRERRSVRYYKPRHIRRDEVERILEAATWAPNHRMTQPWGFIVLGPETKRKYAELRARTKAEKAAEPAAAEAIMVKVASDTRAVPLIVAVTMHLADDPITREEDYAATFMAIQNMLLTAWELGLGSYVRTGRIMDKPELRSLLGVPDDRRIVAIIDFGEPAELREPRPRTPAAQLTRWLD